MIKALELKDINKKFNETVALDNIQLEINARIQQINSKNLSIINLILYLLRLLIQVNRFLNFKFL